MTSEREKANQISNNYLALKNAIKDPNYPSTAHTQAALIKVEDLIKQMGRNEVFKLAFEKFIPEDFEKLMNSK